MAKWSKILIGTGIIIIGAGVFLTTAKQATPFLANSASAARLQPGPFQVSSFDETLVDSTRPTNANSDFEGADSRTLQTRVWYPSGSTEPAPLIVYSHGFSSTKEGGAYIAEQLASLGYVVVAADFPLTNMQAPGGPDLKDVVNQPGDVSFLIDSLLAASNDQSSPLAGKIDPQRIGVTGISLGGMTTTLAAFHPDKADPRISAALSIAGPTAQFTKVFFQHRQLPFLMLATDTDALVPYPTNGYPVLEKVPGAQLVTIKQASHTGFAGTAAMLRWMDNPDAIGCYMVLKNMEKDADEEPWFDLLGTEAQGINYNAATDICIGGELPIVMNPLRQQLITSVVVSSFFQSQFAEDAATKLSAKQFLTETLASELAEVKYENSES